MPGERGPGPQFLKEKYDLHNAPEVESAAKRAERLNGEKVPQNPTDRIENYLDRFKEIVERQDPEKRDRGIAAIKKVFFDKFITGYEDIPASYWQSQETIMRERGQAGDWASASESEQETVKRQTAEALVSDQEASLEQWIDYFASSDSEYVPDALKYWVFRSITGLAEYDKDKKEFPKRSKGTVKEFPDLNQEALSFVVDAVVKKYQGGALEFNYDIQPEDREKFEGYLKGENFAKLYSWAVEKINPIPEHLLTVTEGSWIKYDQGSDHKPLSHSISGKGTGWCTAGENTARSQLSSGDFHVFYSNDDEGNPTIPRIAIRMEEGKIAEVRGIAYKQNLDPFMGDVLAEKLEEFPDKAEYLKKDRDMATLTGIDRKIGTGEPLNKDDLIFIYEIDSNIQGFGYQKDPRIEEIRSKRNPKEDAPIVFECGPSEIAWGEQEVNKNTRAYVGPLTPGIFTKLGGVEHIYTSFPEGKIAHQELEIGGANAKHLEKELEDRGIQVNSYARGMLESKDFQTADRSEQIDLIRLRVKDLGLEGYPTTDQLYARAEELGLELCPAEVGPHLRLQDTEQSMDDWYRIAMKPITDRSGGPDVFRLARYDDGLWLGDVWVPPARTWRPGGRFVFRLRKISQES